MWAEHLSEEIGGVVAQMVSDKRGKAPHADGRVDNLSTSERQYRHDRWLTELIEGPTRHILLLFSVCIGRYGRGSQVSATTSSWRFSSGNDLAVTSVFF